ncbi:cytochrome P450 [Trichoderma citrinoviride]|uniref:Cytochrome P450 n=1 Tax=Trichoderma citrinoviride TaxID=58853 RepID=A0A2T4B086_9HYPO|nr:cytochrome P450 [Trichoderma citrinoviride]PTB62735.1 cytochrome P450 [Trichoderma citrinoviride]
MLFLISLLGGILLWQLLLSMYYLWFSSLSHIPGPKLAAGSLLYEFYYEVVCSGQYTRKIEKMHEVYGPIVRINPHEVHIKDPDFCIEEFSPVKKLDKYGWWYRVFGGPGSTISTEDYRLHKARRATFQNFLSPRVIRGFVPTIIDKLKQASLVMDRHAQTGCLLNLSSIYRCMAADVVSAYVLPQSLNLLQSSDLGQGFQSSLRFFFEAATAMRYLGFLEPLMAIIPPSIFDAMLSDPAKGLIKLVKTLEGYVDDIIQGKKNPQTSRTCLLERININHRDENENFRDRLLQEAEQFIVAGSETTGHTLSVITFYIIQEAEIQGKLREELANAGVVFDEDLEIAKLQTLPYLSAVITEGLRFSHGVGSRLPRINKSREVQFKQWRIPAGVPISMTSRLHHEDARLFPEPHSFRPDRWLQPESRSLKKYLSPFGHGSRICPGMHLALYEIYITIAHILLKFEIKNCGTISADLVSVHDLGAPFPKHDSKGLQVKLEARNS